jgi:hypothetical protein
LYNQYTHSTLAFKISQNFAVEVEISCGHPPKGDPFLFTPPQTLITILFSYFWWYCIWSQGLILASQELHHLSHTAIPFWFSYSSGRGLHFCSGPASDLSPLTYASHVARIARITDATNHTQPVGWDMVSLNFLPRLASNHDPLDVYLLSSWDYRWTLPHLACNCHS